MKKLIAALALTFTISPAMAEEEMVVNIKRLSMETTQAMAMAAVEECRKQGINVGVTVVDRNGIPQVMLRDTLAAHLTIEISKRKAYTAANFNAATSTPSASAALRPAKPTKCAPRQDWMQSPKTWRCSEYSSFRSRQKAAFGPLFFASPHAMTGIDARVGAPWPVLANPPR